MKRRKETRTPRRQNPISGGDSAAIRPAGGRPESSTDVADRPSISPQRDSPLGPRSKSPGRLPELFRKLRRIPFSGDTIPGEAGDGHPIRVVPAKTLFQPFHRMVLNLAETEGKKVVLKIAGEETTLDESLAKRIGDPLAHLIRNAVDHGIETPKERADQGKPETGVIQLRAYLEGENSVIEISDDGRGMDAHLIRKQAVERNLVTPTEVKRMSENEILNLVFLPGFSTAEKITDVSGRGFGMDVVQNTLRKVNGSVFLKSRPGRGCKISLRFPRSPAGRRNPRGA